MTDKAQAIRIAKQLQEIRRTRPDVYDLIEKALDLPDDKYAEFMTQAMPILRKGLN